MKKHFISVIAITLATIIVSANALSQTVNDEILKFARTLGLIEAYYVDTANIGKLTEKAIVEILKTLDPHSTYTSAKDVRDMRDQLTGNFDGIGIQFNILRDSIIVVEPIAGGPSERVGLRAGDRIVVIDNEKVTGIGLNNAAVRSRLLGARGTKVNVLVYRKGENELLDFIITRDRIPIYSLDASYMLNDDVGYIKLNKFAATTEREFSEAVAKLQNDNNMQHLVLDLRGNGGGYMLAATQIAEKFFSDRKLLVYISGRRARRQNYNSAGNGNLASMRIVVLTDETSASASEILAGALQDWDRGVIMGRRTFGKGTVQNEFDLQDGSMIRLTTARYYTPAGRSIQSPYDEGYDRYYENFYRRDVFTADNINLPDSLKHTTLINKRTVYGGGGIIPDVFVAVDTTYSTQYLRRLFAREYLFDNFAVDYFDKNYTQLTDKYKNFSEFKSDFQFSQEDINDFIARAEAAGVGYNEQQFNTSREVILLNLKGYLATNLWQTSESLEIVQQNDKVIERALQVISDVKVYNEVLGYK